MADPKHKLLLVGDNPFHGVSHVSQERAYQRGPEIREPEYAAEIVATALHNGADGFTFTVDETTLSILRTLRKYQFTSTPKLYAFVPYAYKYVRLAVSLGGIVGLGKMIATQIILSWNVKAIINGIKGALAIDPGSAFKAYDYYEAGRIKAAAGKSAELDCIFIHEVVTDMALALDMRWLFDSHITAMHELNIRPGFHTRNLPFLLDKFRGWNIKPDNIILTTPFNAIGMQMNPSKLEAEEALNNAAKYDVIIFAILAGGLLTLEQAWEYVESLPNVYGIAVGVSKKVQAENTFGFIINRSNYCEGLKGGIENSTGIISRVPVDLRSSH